MRKRHKRKKRIIICFLLLIITTGIAFGSIKIYLDKKAEEQRQYELYLEEQKRIAEEKRKAEIYENCQNTPYLADTTTEKINEFLTKYSNENFAIYFEDINNEYTILKNETTSFYGASLIKVLDATYLIRKALAGEIDLKTETVTYEARHKRDYSLGMDNHTIGEQISLETLIGYALSVSDNAAHEMLYEYIGVNNLRTYASSLGITITANSVEHFGYLNADYTHKILEEVYDIILMDNSYSELLTTNMNNTYFNSLNFDDVVILHKYGSYNPYFHDIGIYNDEEYPYFISVMTTIGEQASPNKITELHQEIRTIYEENLEAKENYCYALAYNKTEE